MPFPYNSNERKADILVIEERKSNESAQVYAEEEGVDEDDLRFLRELEKEN